MTSLTYLDNAATSFPKPPTVAEAVARYFAECGAAVGRGAYDRARQIQGVVQRCRQQLAQLWKAESAERIVFTNNGSHGLNLVLHGLLRPGDHVVTTEFEHNSVIRPLHWLQTHHGVQVTRVSSDSEGRVDPQAVADNLRPETRLVCVNHASNVTGAVQPVAEIGALTRQRKIHFLVDAAQSAGYIPIDVAAAQIDFLACPGHKGLLGPLGTGVLYVRQGLEQELSPLMQGGSGTHSEQAEPPEDLPERLEVGNLNAPGICGLAAGVDWLQQQPASGWLPLPLIDKLRAGLADIPGIDVYGPATGPRVGVVSFNLRGCDPQDLAAMLDGAGIAVRAGLHCAPGAHQRLGTLDQGGTVRASLGHFSTDADVDTLLTAMAQIAEGFA